MSISSVRSSEALYWASLKKGTSAATSTTNESTSSKKTSSSTDSSATQESLDAMMSMLSAISDMYAGNSQTNTSGEDSNSDLKSFLDKVRNGTVTAEDLTSLQALLANGLTSPN